MGFVLQKLHFRVSISIKGPLEHVCVCLQIIIPTLSRSYGHSEEPLPLEYEIEIKHLWNYVDHQANLT